MIQPNDDETQGGVNPEDLGFQSLGSAIEDLLGPLGNLPNADALLEGYAAGRADGRQLSHREGFQCSACRDSGWTRRDVMPGEAGFGEVVLCPCPAGSAITQRRQERIWQDADVPPKFRRYTLDSLGAIEGKAGLARALSEWHRSPDWLLLWGPPGTCKSGGAVAILREHLAQGGQGLFMLLNRVLERMQATFGASSTEATFQQAFRALVDAELLVLDDIGANRKPLSPWGQNLLFEIVDARDLAERRTILTTNLQAAGASEFPKYVGAPTWDRIRGRCGRWIVETTGPSQRGRDVEG